MNELLVSAASSLADVLPEISRAFSGGEVKFNFGASGALMAQIRQGAPVDVFLSASTEEMAALKLPYTVFARNKLVLIAPKQSKLAGWNDLAGPNVRRIALANPGFVPAGRYAKETLVHRKLWATVEKKLVFGQSVRQALSYVASGDADAGLVFLTDALRENRVRVVATAVPGRDHAPILYAGAALAGSKNPELARKFVDFLTTPPAQSVFRRFGFAPPGK